LIDAPETPVAAKKYPSKIVAQKYKSKSEAKLIDFSDENKTKNF